MDQRSRRHTFDAAAVSGVQQDYWDDGPTPRVKFLARVSLHSIAVRCRPIAVFWPKPSEFCLLTCVFVPCFSKLTERPCLQRFRDDATVEPTGARCQAVLHCRRHINRDGFIAIFPRVLAQPVSGRQIPGRWSTLVPVRNFALPYRCAFFSFSSAQQ
jgi:hypothetical protein